MEQLRNLIANLTLRQKITIALAALAVIGGLFGFSRWNKERDFKPLYRNLAAEDAGAVLARLRESGVEYRLTDNGASVLVPSTKVAETRLQLASAGLPKTGRMGFELFDRTNLGTTDFAEQVNYHRALEGELERSVMALSEVETARVHVTLPKDSVFVEHRQPAKASIMVKLKPGASLSPHNVQAVMHLVASAVEGLNPDAVSVLDMQGNLLNRPKKHSPDGNEPSDSAIEYRQKVEKDLLAKMNATLEPLLGKTQYRAGVFVECDFSSGEVSEETLDPTKSAPSTLMRTMEGSASALAGGLPGTPSNLPRPAAAPAAAGAAGAANTAGITRQTENVTYQNSRLVKHMRLPQGNIRKISASLLIDHRQRWEGVGANAKRITEPVPPERLKAIKDVVAAAIGVSADRGDQLIVETLPFETTLGDPPAPKVVALPPAAGGAPASKAPAGFAIPLPPWLQKYVGQSNMPILIGVAAGIILMLLFGFVFLVLRRRKRKATAAIAAKELAESKANGALGAGSTEDIEKQLEAQMAEQQAIREKQAAEVLSSLKLPPPPTKKAEALAKHIADEAKKDPAGMAQIVRSWLTEGES